MENIRVSVFIDGRNFYHSTKNFERRGYEIKLHKIVNELVGNRELVNVFYYNALLDKSYDLEKYKKHIEFLESLKLIPKFNVVLCDWRKIKNKDGSFRYDIKGDDIQLAHDLLMGAVDDLYDVAIIVSGDADFIPIVKTVRKRFNKKIGNGYFRRTSSYKLRKSCDFSVNLNKIILR
ncbi:NYN domain-containing protein [Nanoarchaeota archaeon]